jgi:hypothetical protein
VKKLVPVAYAKRAAGFARPQNGGILYFCIRDDDTSFFTSPDELDKAYGEITRWGPVSLAVVPFHRAGNSKGVPAKFRGQMTIHPLHENENLVGYLCQAVAAGRFEIMLHGYHHDEPNGGGEFVVGSDLPRKALEGRRYLEDLLHTRVRVFVPPRNAIACDGLRAIVKAGLHLGGTGGVRSGWPILRWSTWANWYAVRKRKLTGGLGVPWILNLMDHHEIPGNAVTPVASFAVNKAVFEETLRIGGIFCAATHYWELNTPSLIEHEPRVGEHLRYLVDCARADDRVIWKSVGDIVSDLTLAG